MVKRLIGDYLEDILTHIDLAQKFIDGMTFEEFEKDDKTILALTRAIEVIGEASKQVPLALRENHPEIAWKDLAGMRDKLAHVYFATKLDVLWDTTQDDLPQLKPVIQTLLNAEDS